MEKIISCHSVRHRLHILSFTETCYESFLDFENISLYTLQDTCGGPDTELKLDIMKLTCYIIQRTVFSKHQNISYEIIIWSSHDHHKMISSRILVIWHLTLNINLVSNWKVEQKMEAADKLLSAQVNNRRGSRKIRIWNHYKYGRFCKDLLLSST